MAIERISLRQISSYHGVEDLAPPELQAAFVELIRRLDVNTRALQEDLIAQVVVDSSVLPNISVGESAAGTETTQTNTDVEQSMLMSMMM